MIVLKKRSRGSPVRGVNRRHPARQTVDGKSGHRCRALSVKRRAYKPWPKCYTNSVFEINGGASVPQTAARRVEADVLELVQNAIILNPKDTAFELAQTLLAEVGVATVGIDTTEAGVLGKLGPLFDLAQVLMRQYLIRAINAERRMAHPRPEQPPLFPGIDNLPRRIVTAEGKRPLLAKSTATQIREYVKSLNNKHRDRIAGLQSVLEIMGKYTPKNRKLTAQAVAALEFED